MKTRYKVLISLMIGICLIIVGVSIGGFGQMKLSRFDFLNDYDFIWSPNKIDDVEYQATSKINKIELNTSIAEIEFYEKNDIDNIVVTASHVYSGFEVKQNNHELKISQPHYQFINDRDKEAKIKIAVPKGYQFQKIDINTSVGTTMIQNMNAKEVSIDNSVGKLIIDQVVCHSLELDTGMSQTTISQLTCQNQLDIDVGMGEVHILLNGHKQDYNYSVEVGMGSVQIDDEKFSGFVEKDFHDTHLKDRYINVDCGMGSVNIEMED